jgi:hypothetical protein
VFGEYDGEFQLRPGVKSWLTWAHENFEVVWLTSWAPEKIKTLLGVLYCEKFIKHLPDQPFQHANWNNHANKVVWLSRAMPKLAGREWYWIDDDVKAFAKEIEELKLPKERCIQVSEQGAGALGELRNGLEKLSYQCKGAE